ncbi:lysine transporter LysE [filamentous cyanobacterium CCP5]|nr:lysine transporter LysE [filamentous cyanobacterium CCP5]
MELAPLLKGIGIGFAIAVPVGPIGLLCIRRTLAQGQLIGLASGLGAATADGLYGGIAGFGLSAISQWLLDWSAWLQGIGGLFLCYLGVTTFLAQPATTPAAFTSRGLATAYSSTFVLTLTNPVTILSFIAIFAGLGLVNPSGERLAAGLIVAGVFLGSALWWLMLSVAVSWLRSRFTLQAMQWLNRLAGLAILTFGIVALGTSR